MVKNKHVANPVEPAASTAPAIEPTATPAPAEKRAFGKPAGPMLYLAAGDTQYKFTRFPLPKKSMKVVDGEAKLNVNGSEVPAWFTSSKGWAKEDANIDYVWLTFPGKPEVTGYITLDYGKPAAAFCTEVGPMTTGEGKANRVDPKREPRDPAKEAGRIEQFKGKMAKKTAVPIVAQAEPAPNATV